jgi:hypothetical protein
MLSFIDQILACPLYKKQTGFTGKERCPKLILNPSPPCGFSGPRLRYAMFSLAERKASDKKLAIASEDALRRG